jgi:hypothetical protein
MQGLIPQEQLEHIRSLNSSDFYGNTRATEMVNTTYKQMNHVNLSTEFSS